MIQETRIYRHQPTDRALSCPTDLGSGLPHLPESPQQSGGSRALAIEPLGDILKNAHMGFASCRR